MRVDPKRALSGLFIAGVAGAFLLLPALSFVGSMLAPSQPTPSATHVPQLLGDAIWARANGGRATELQPLNPFTIGRMVSCHVMAEALNEGADVDKEHNECMKLLPGVEAVGYLSTVHMRSEGVWDDPRVPFVQIANMTRMSSKWTRAELLDALAARGEFGSARFRGMEAAADGYFGRPVDQLTLPQAALLGASIGDIRVDPWCAPQGAAAARHRILERMRDNQVIDEAAFQQADLSELGVSQPPADHKPCTD